MSPTSPRKVGAGRARQHPPTPAPIKVHRDSHLIHKAPSSSPPSSSSTNSSVSSSPGAANGAGQWPAPRQKQHQQPVIIYTHSPKVIRTNPRDFMSIVQKLTGLESAASSVVTAQEESSSSSESCANAAAPPHYMDPQLTMPPPPLDVHFMPDMPLFGHGASEQLLCASRGIYGQFPPVDAAALGPVMSANMHNAAGPVFTPSMAEAMRTFADY